MMGEVRPIVVATCGNADAGDDAFGPLTAIALTGRRLTGVDVARLDNRPAALLDHLGGREVLIVVDAVRGPGLEAGRLVEMDWFAPSRPALVDEDVLSTHGLSIANQIALAEAIGLRPRVVRLVGLAVTECGVSMPARVDLAAMAEAAAERIAVIAASIASGVEAHGERAE